MVGCSSNPNFDARRHALIVHLDSRVSFFLSVVATAVPASVLQSIDVQASCRRKSRLACVESDGQRWGKGKGRASRRSERVKCRENRRRGVGGKWVHARWKGGASTASRPTGACGAGRTGGPEWTPGTHPACRGGRIRWDAGAAKSRRRVDRAPAHAVPWGQGFDLAGPQRLGEFAPGGR